MCKKNNNDDIKKLLTASLDEQQAKALFAMGEEAVVFALLTLTAELAKAKGENAQGQPSPATPSGSVPVHLKENNKGKRLKKPGRKPGHKGSRRVSPEPDKTVTLSLECCPDCGGPVNECRAKSTRRKRIVEDIPEGITTETTEYDIPTYWCPHCKNTVSPKVPDAMPNCAIGNRLAVMTAWLHYAMGNSISQIIDIFNVHLQVKLTPGGLTQIWHRLALTLNPWHDEIREKCLASGVLHGDESGWRVNGQTHWLWCFATQRETYYMIDRSRGQPALQEFFNEFYDGVLVSDFWKPYDHIASAGTQKCLVHLLREFRHVKKYKDVSKDWSGFRKRVKRLMQDAIRLWYERESHADEVYARRCALIEKRLDKILSESFENPEAVRIAKRLRKYRDALFTFLYHPAAPFDNNHAERSIRPAVLMRRISHGNQSTTGADTQSILMSVFRTLHLRGLPPTATLCAALREFVLTGKLPTMEKFSSNG